MYLNRRGEIATILTIAAFVFIGVASLTSSYLLDKPQTTSSSAQTSNRCNPDIGNGMPCSTNGEWCINCLSKQASCNSNAGVGIPFQCEGGVWKNKNVYGECNITCVVAGQTNPTTAPVNPPTSGGNNPYGVFIDGPGRSCGSNKGGANNLGCGGDDGCRFWEVCQNGGCLDTTSNGTTQPGANACMGEAGSKAIWTDAEIQAYNNNNTQNTPVPNTPIPQSGTRGCSIGTLTYAHGEKYCTAGGDVGQCNDSKLTTVNNCDPPLLPCDTTTKNCATKPASNPTTQPTQVVPTQGGFLQSNFKGCQLLGRPYAHGAKECNDDDVIQCDNGQFKKLVDCFDTLPCDTKTKQCATVASLIPNQCRSDFDGLVNNGELFCAGEKLYKCNNGQGDLQDTCSQYNFCNAGKCVNEATTGAIGDVCDLAGEPAVTYDVEPKYIGPCQTDLYCKDDGGGMFGRCTKKPSIFTPNTQLNKTNQCKPATMEGIIYSYKTEGTAGFTSYYLGPICSEDTKISYAELTDLAGQTVTYKFSKTDACGISCGSIGMSQIGVSNSSGKCWCWPF